MILTCPECATSYFVDDSRIPEAGRTVKCTSCAHRWTAHREATAFAAEADPPEGFEPQPEAAPQPRSEQAVPEDDLEFVTPEPDPEAARAEARRVAAAARAQLKGGGRSGREAKSKAMVFATAAVAVVALVGGAIVFRSDVVKFVPGSQKAFAGVGLSVNSVGLVIEGVHAEPTFVAGRPVLSVTGVLRNVKDEAVNAPPLRVNLLGRNGKPIAAKIVRPIDPKVPAGASRHFAIAISDPPANARDLEVVFETGQKTAVTPAGAQPPAPVEAQPLPPGAPETLPEHG